MRRDSLTAGRYHAKIKIDMSGDWNAKISFNGPHGQGQQSFVDHRKMMRQKTTDQRYSPR